MSQHEITHNSIRKLEKNKKALNSTIYHDIAKDDTIYLMLDSMLYHKIAIDSSFSNKLYPCAPIVCLVIFLKLFAKGMLRPINYNTQVLDKQGKISYKLVGDNVVLYKSSFTLTKH